jgi:hypothetical protein
VIRYLNVSKQIPLDPWDKSVIPGINQVSFSFNPTSTNLQTYHGPNSRGTAEITVIQLNIFLKYLVFNGRRISISICYFTTCTTNTIPIDCDRWNPIYHCCIGITCHMVAIQAELPV